MKSIYIFLEFIEATNQASLSITLLFLALWKDDTSLCDYRGKKKGDAQLALQAYLHFGTVVH